MNCNVCVLGRVVSAPRNGLITRWRSYNSTQCWPNLLWEILRSHMWMAQSYTSAPWIPHFNTSWKSARTSYIFEGPVNPFFGSTNLLEWLRELRNNWWLIYYKKIKLGTALCKCKEIPCPLSLSPTPILPSVLQSRNPLNPLLWVSFLFLF